MTLEEKFYKCGETSREKKASLPRGTTATILDRKQNFNHLFSIRLPRNPSIYFFNTLLVFRRSKSAHHDTSRLPVTRRLTCSYCELLYSRTVCPGGTIILKSTVVEKSFLHLAPIVIDEIRVQGSRCGPFAPALRALKQKLVDVRPLISATFSLDDGLAAFQHAGQKGVLKVLVHM